MFSSDSLAILLLCSRLGLSGEATIASLTLREWNQLVKKLQAASLRPGNLFDLNAEEMQSQLYLSSEEVQRFIQLFNRLDQLSTELERFAQLGIRVLTRTDPDYPKRYLLRLKESAPPVLFYAGEPALLGQPGIAVVGSRRLDPVGQECAAYIGNACGLLGLVLYTGGAKGVDSLSMAASLEARGAAVCLLADSLIRSVRQERTRNALDRGDLCLATPYSPDAGFSVGAAMGRNRLIYTLADYAIIVASDLEKGGTWAGATEALKAGWIPLFVLDHPAMPAGNRALLERGGIAFPYPFPEHYQKLHEWFESHSGQPKSKHSQLGLF
jgi:predicted Rossmann fold nucleotide-binding protein DprA/Smf involved in DNA uptake